MQGILMTPDNHKAIREKRKFQTRRLDHLKEINKAPNLWKWIGYDQAGRFSFRFEPSGDIYNYFPRYRVGETVYIKEAWQVGEYTYKKCAFINYKDGDKKLIFNWNNWLEKNTQYGGSSVGDGDKWRSPMFLPEWASRDYIKITDVGLGQLTDITEEDAKAEGAECVIWHNDYAFAYDKFIAIPTYKAGFANLWDSINKAYPFDGNYWCWRTCFNLIEDKQ